MLENWCLKTNHFHFCDGKEPLWRSFDTCLLTSIFPLNSQKFTFWSDNSTFRIVIILMANVSTSDLLYWTIAQGLQIVGTWWWRSGWIEDHGGSFVIADNQSKFRQSLWRFFELIIKGVMFSLFCKERMDHIFVI